MMEYVNVTAAVTQYYRMDVCQIAVLHNKSVSFC